MCSDQRRLALGLYHSRLTTELLDAAHNAGIGYLDCAYNYGNFDYLRLLGEMRAAERFSISSKVGYFPTPTGTEHCLEPRRMREAAEHTVELLGRPVDVLFLHNPEASFADEPGQAEEQLGAACATMADAVATGLAERWGIATWGASPALRKALETMEQQPSAVMVRVGLTVPGAALQAACELINQLDLAQSACWGMSPLGGTLARDLLDAADYRAFVTGKASNAQAALRIAYELLPVGTVCLSTSSPDHLEEATSALALGCRAENLSRYRTLIHQ